MTNDQDKPMLTRAERILMKALTETTYSFQSDRMLLEPKELVKAKIGHSPDDFDAAILTFAEPVNLQPLTRRGGRMLVDYNAFEEVDNPQRGTYADQY